jgi:hypothetical protein
MASGDLYQLLQPRMFVVIVQAKKLGVKTDA